MAGIKIKISTEEAQTATKKLSTDLEKLGATSKLTEAQIAKLQSRMTEKMGMDKASDAINRVAQSVGMSSKEIEKFHATLAPPGFAERVTSGFNRIKANWMALAGTAFAVGIAINQAFSYAKLGASAQQAEESFRIVAFAAKENANEIVDAMTRVSQETVDNSDIMQKAVKGMVMGLKGNEIVKIMEVARTSARIAGEDIKTAYENITDAISTNMPRSLKRYGLIAKEELALVNKAIAAGIEDIDLLGLVLSRAAVQQAKMGPLALSTAENLQKFQAQVQQLKEDIGKGLIWVLQELFGVFQAVAAGVLTVASGFAYLVGGVNDLQSKLAGFRGNKKVEAELKGLADAAYKVGEDLYGASVELANKSAQNIAGVDKVIGEADQKAIARAEANHKKFIKNMSDKIKAQQGAAKAAQAYAAALEDINNAIAKSEAELQMIGKVGFEKEIHRINLEVEKYKAKGISGVKTERYATLEILKIKKALQVEITELIRKTDLETQAIGKTAYEQELVRIQGEVEKYRKAGAEKVQIAKLTASMVAKVNAEAKEQFKEMDKSTLGFGETENERQIRQLILDNEKKVKQIQAWMQGGTIGGEKAPETKSVDSQILDVNQRSLGIEIDQLNSLRAIEAKLTGKPEPTPVPQPKPISEPIPVKKVPPAVGQEEGQALIDRVNEETRQAQQKLDYDKLKKEEEYYATIKGYEDVAFQKKMQRIELEKQMHLASYEAIAAAAKKSADASSDAAAKAVNAADAAIAAMDAAVLAGDNIPQKDRDDAAKASKDAKAALAKADAAAEKSMKSQNTLLQEQTAAEAKALQETGKAKQDVWDANSAEVNAGINSMITAFQAIGSMYDENSKEYAMMQDAAKAMIVLQQAVAVANAVAAIANQGLGDPYTAFARIAAMVAAMGALLATIGKSIGGGSSISARKKEQAEYMAKPESTVLGAKRGTASESLEKSWEILEDMYDLQYHELKGIHSSMKLLNTNIMGLVNQMVRGYGEFAGTGTIGEYTTAAFKQNQKAMEGFFGMAFSIMADPISQLFKSKLVNNVTNFLFGGKVKSYGTVSSGLETGAASVGNLAAGQDVSAAIWDTQAYKKSGSIFSSSKRWQVTYWQAVDAQTQDLITKVYENIGNTLIELTRMLGTDMQKTLNYVLPGLHVELKGLSGEEINKKLKEEFSAMGDRAVDALFGHILRQYQKVNEGLLETATRVVTDMVVVQSVLGMTNQKFAEFGRVVMEGNMAVFLSMEQAATVTTYFDAALGKWVVTWKLTKAEIIAMTEEMIELAGGLDKLTEAAETYYDAFFDEGEKFVKTQKILTENLADYNLQVPKARDGWRDLVEAQDLMTKSGRETYVALLQMSEAADQLYSYLDNLIDKVKDARESMQLANRSIDEQRMTFKRATDTVKTALVMSWSGDFSWGDSEIVDKALDTVSSISTNTYADKMSYERDYWKTYNLLAELEAAAGGEISYEDQMVNLTEQEIQILESIHRAITGQATTVSVGNYTFPNSTATTGGTTTTGGTVTTGTPYTNPTAAAYAPEIAIPESLRAFLKSGQAWAASLLMPGDWLKWFQAMFAGGFDITKAVQSVKGYAEGGVHTGGWRVVGEKGPELEYTGASRIFSNDDTKSIFDTAAIIEELNKIEENTRPSDEEESVYALLRQQLKMISKDEMEFNKKAHKNSYEQSSRSLLYQILTAGLQKTEVDLTETGQSILLATVTGITQTIDLTQAIIDATNEMNQILANIAAGLVKTPATTGTTTTVQGHQAGGSHTGGWRVVGEGGPELEFTPASTIYSNAQSKKMLDNTEVVSELRAVKVELKTLRSDLAAANYAIAKNTNKSAKVAERWDVDGLPAERTYT